MKPIKQALIAWSRASELSADRVACLITSAETLSRALARISMIPQFVVEDMDLNEWALQGRDYEALKSGTAWNKIVRWMMNSDADHPFCPVRAYEVMEWEKTDICKKIKNTSNCLNITNGQQSVIPTTEDLKSKMTGLALDISSKAKDVSINSVFSKFKK